MSRVSKDVEDGIERAKAEAIRSGNQAAVDYLSSEAAEIRFAAIQKAKIDELTVSNSAWMRRLVSHQVLTEYLNAIEVNANKVVIPGSHKPVFSLDSNGNISIDTPLLKVRGEELATKSQLSKLSLTHSRSKRRQRHQHFPNRRILFGECSKIRSYHINEWLVKNHSSFNGYHQISLELQTNRFH